MVLNYLIHELMFYFRCWFPLSLCDNSNMQNRRRETKRQES